VQASIVDRRALLQWIQVCGKADLESLKTSKVNRIENFAIMKKNISKGATTFNTMTLSITTFSITTLSTLTFSIIINKSRHSA
jgi:hypothetical protein